MSDPRRLGTGSHKFGSLCDSRSCVPGQCYITGTFCQERYQLLCSNFERQFNKAWFQP